MVDRRENFIGTNLVDAYFRVWRAQYPPVPGVPTQVSTEEIEQQPDVYGTREAQRKSIIGTDVVLPIKLGGIDLPDSTVMRVTGGKRIIETDLNTDKGTFKELWSNNDWLVVLRGFIVQHDGTENYPKDQVRELRQLIDEQKSLEVESEMCTLFGIDLLAVYDYDFPELIGSPSVQPFELRCKSDYLFDLELKTSGT